MQILASGHNFYLVKNICVLTHCTALTSTDCNDMSFLFKECSWCISQSHKAYFTQGSSASDATMQSVSNLFSFANVSKNWVLEAKHIKC